MKVKMSERKPSVRDIAIEKARENFQNENSVERSLLVIGNRNSGKTNIIHQLIGEQKYAGNPPSTYSLEYSYGRYSGKKLDKDVCNIWELGNGVTFVSLIPVITRVKHFLTVVLVIDLTSPEKMLHTVETLLNTTKSVITESSEEHLIKLENRIGANVEEEDRLHLDPFPVPLIIVGGKYDIFQNTEPSKKRIICQYIRCLSHIVQADLLFYSNKDVALTKKVREFLLHYAFGISLAKNTLETDYNKPLRIPTGYDSFRSIQGSPATSINYSIDKYKNSLITYFEQEIDEDPIPDDPATNPNFAEPEIDNLLQQKIQELNRMKEQRKKMSSIQFNKTQR